MSNFPAQFVCCHACKFLLRETVTRRIHAGDGRILSAKKSIIIWVYEQIVIMSFQNVKVLGEETDTGDSGFVLLKKKTKKTPINHKTFFEISPYGL